MISVIASKSLAGVLLAAACPFALRSRALRNTSDKDFRRLWLGFWLITRIALYIVYYLLMRQAVVSDVNAYYDYGVLVRGGYLPYRDFLYQYGPLFPYVCGFVTLFWDSPKAIVLLTLLFELAALIFWSKTLADMIAPEVARATMVLYLCNPLPLAVAFVGQNQHWLAAALAASVLLSLRRREIASGAAYAASIAVVKVTALLYLPALLFSLRRPFRWCAVWGSIVLASYAPFLLAGIDVRPFKGVYGLAFTSGNLLYLASALSYESFLPRWLFPGSAAVLALLLLRMRLRREFSFVEMCAAMWAFHLLLALFSSQSYTSYFVIVMLPICTVLAARETTGWRLGVWLVFVNVLVVEPSLWFRWMEQQDLGPLFDAGVRTKAFLAVEILLVSLNLFYLRDVAKYLFASLRQDVPAQEPA
jgi:hypothetical protein